MKSGRRGDRGREGFFVAAVMGPWEGVGPRVSDLTMGLEGVGEEGETRSIIRAILSSSSGQISGQCVNPKYTWRTRIRQNCRFEIMISIVPNQSITSTA